jgi:hypothetical protein
MSKTLSRSSKLFIGLGFFGIVLAGAAAKTCYQASTINCCVLSSPAPNLSRTCSVNNCPDVITSDPSLPFAVPVTNGKNLASGVAPTCTCEWEVYNCALFGISCYNTGTTSSGTATGSDVDLQSACTGGGPG